MPKSAKSTTKRKRVEEDEDYFEPKINKRQKVKNEINIDENQLCSLKNKINEIF